MGHRSSNKIARKTPWVSYRFFMYPAPAEKAVTVRHNLPHGLDVLQVKHTVHPGRETVEVPGGNVRQKAGLNRSIHAQAWSWFGACVMAKAGASGTWRVVAVPTAFTSQHGPACGYTEKNRAP